MNDLDRNAKLAVLTAGARVTFAACCCERVLPAYENFSREDGWGDPRPLRDALERVWASVNDKPVDAKEAQLLVSRCAEQVPHLDDPFTSIFTSAAQNAAIAVLRAVECAVEGDVELAQGVGDIALDAFETYVDATDGHGAFFDAELITSSRIYQDELACQREDLSTLAELWSLEPSSLERLRQRAQAAGFASI